MTSQAKSGKKKANWPDVPDPAVTTRSKERQQRIEEQQCHLFGPSTLASEVSTVASSATNSRRNSVEISFPADDDLSEDEETGFQRDSGGKTLDTTVKEHVGAISKVAPSVAPIAPSVVPIAPGVDNTASAIATTVTTLGSVTSAPSSTLPAQGGVLGDPSGIPAHSSGAMGGATSAFSVVPGGSAQIATTQADLHHVDAS